MEMFESVSAGEKVLLVWSDLGSNTDSLPQLVNSLQQLVGQSGRVSVENAERLMLGGHQKSSFTQIFSNMVGIPSWRHDTDFLGHLLTILAPNGILHLAESPTDESSLRSKLVLSGYTAVGEPEEIQPPELSGQNIPVLCGINGTVSGPIYRTYTETSKVAEIF
jgi:hypothetical protein